MGHLSSVSPPRRDAMRPAQTTKRIPVFALTGGIGSGKSFVRNALEQRGAYTADADALARTVLGPGAPALARVVALFGPSVLDDHGCLNRKALAHVVFNQPEQRRILEALVHPRVRKLAALRFAQAQTFSAPYVVYEIPLLVEAEGVQTWDGIIATYCPFAERLRRLAARDATDLASVRARMRAQAPEVLKVQRSHWVIDTGVSSVHLQQQLDELHRLLSRKRSQRRGQRP